MTSPLKLDAAGVANIARAAQSLPASIRERLARDWAHAARFEHASIAAFNRFSLELLRLAAPAELVHDANRAAMDEIEHARACFAVASAYAGASLGPGPLELGDLRLGETDLASAARSTADEGCVGETLAAMEADEARRRAELPELQALLATIAEDEQRHAGLAFRFVRWACEVGGTSVRGAARDGFRAAVARYRSAPPMDGFAEAAVERHGRLGAATRRAVHERALNELLGPLERELFG